MGIDLGTKTIGLALSDVERRLATPLETIKRRQIHARTSKKCWRWRTSTVLRPSLSACRSTWTAREGPRAQSTRAFVRQTAPLARRPFVFWDERLSTAAVTRELIAQDVSRGKRAEVVDRMAAAYILQGALDRLYRLGLGAMAMIMIEALFFATPKIAFSDDFRTASTPASSLRDES